MVKLLQKKLMSIAGYSFLLTWCLSTTWHSGLMSTIHRLRSSGWAASTDTGVLRRFGSSWHVIADCDMTRILLKTTLNTTHYRILHTS